MRRRRLQKSLTGPDVDHEYAEELRAISRLLDSQPGLRESVRQDLTRLADRPETGAPGMSGSEVLRALLIKKLFQLSYRELAFYLADSRTFGTFCGYGPLEDTPARATLAENIGRVRPETWRELSREVVRHAMEEGVEDGLRVRIDAMVTETDVHEPRDSHQLWDGVRALTRLMEEAEERFGFTAYSDHTLRAKRRAREIRHCREGSRRKDLYRDLLRVTEWGVEYAGRAILFLEGGWAEERTRARKLVAKLRRFRDLLERVIDQARRRVLEGESVPASEKVLSVFEPHTDLIIKKGREVEFGHKIFLTGGASGLVLDCKVADGNPADSTRAVPLLERQESLYGEAPEQAAFDGGFASKANVAAAQELGVDDVAFHKKRGLEVGEMVRSSWVYKRLRAFRAGIEGTISFLKRAFGLDRCTWEGADGFRAYVHSSVLAANLLTLVRQMGA